MNQKRPSMRKLREVLRLKFDCKLSNRTIAKSVNISASTVSYYTRAFLAAELSWPLPERMSDDELMRLLEPHCLQLTLVTSQQKQLPCFKIIYNELKRKGVTLQLLWQEYHDNYPSKSYSYSEFCRRYRAWTKRLNPVMRQTHKAGEKCFVDYAGPTIDIYNPQSGHINQAKIFVATLGASGLVFAEATLTRSIPDWLGSHTRMLEYFGGVPKLIIPDNEKAGVTQASYYDPEKNPHYCAWACHYNTTVLPTRPRKPRDKAKVEAAVKLVEQAILAKLRHRKFFSIKELNTAIIVLLAEMNDRPFQKLPGSRRSQFESIERDTLKALPTVRYEHVEIKRIKVGLDYHICVEGHYYSVPYCHVNQTVEYRLGRQYLEIYKAGQRIASHIRKQSVGDKTTLTEHMPKSHRAHEQWTPLTFHKWASALGKPVQLVTESILNRQTHPECCYRIFLGLKRLYKNYGNKRFLDACQCAVQGQAISYHSIKAILKNGLDQTSILLNEDEEEFTPTYHINIRGAHYYH